VLVGELRDLETVSIAIETAETGHLVFATLHTTSAAGTTLSRMNSRDPRPNVEPAPPVTEDGIGERLLLSNVPPGRGRDPWRPAGARGCEQDRARPARPGDGPRPARTST